MAHTFCCLASPNALTYNHRLHYRWEYRRFFNQSESFRLSECIVFRVGNDLGHYRLGITLKARGSSIERNRVKRQIRENFRKLGATLGSYDYNVVVPASRKMAHPYDRRLGETLKKEMPEKLASLKPSEVTLSNSPGHARCAPFS